MSGRIEYIDTAKAIAIILVIIGHCYWIKDLPRVQSFIYSFHVPLFFLISGFFIKDLKIKDAVRKYSKAYLWPYLIVAMLILTIGIIKSLLHGQCWYDSIRFDIIKILWGSNIENGKVLFGNIPHIGPSWFLLALFFGCLLFTCVRKLEPQVLQVVSILLLACLSVFSARLIKLPWSFQAGCVALLYIYIGFVIKSNNLLEQIFKAPFYVKIGGLALWVWVFLTFRGIDIGSANLGYSIIGFTASIIGALFVLDICKRTKLKAGWTGRNTLSILCAHILLWRIFDIFGISARHLTLSPNANFCIEAIVQIFGALLLAWLLSASRILNYNKLFK